MESTGVSIADRLERVKERIAAAAGRAGRDASDVTLVAVTKMVTAETARQGLALGLTDLGENRVQEGLAKQDVLGRNAARWHLIGTLQTNKARRAAESFELIHSLDRPALAEALIKAGRGLGRPIPALIQVNVSGEASKHGLSPDELAPFVARLIKSPELRLEGLMTMAPLSTDPERTRPVFARLRELFDRMKSEFALGREWQWLSMGMTQDFEIAVEEGANMVRIGTAIFGGQRGGDGSARMGAGRI